jgi:hypothetical protein
MKKWILSGVFCICSLSAFSQSQEAEQLLLNVEKLTQLKSILTDMKKGYTILSQGYGSIKQIAQGNFSLHQSFLDGMMLVSPEIKKYHRVADIVAYQRDLVKTYKSAFEHFKAGGSFSAPELAYLGRVYQELFEQSLGDLDQLFMVITNGKLGMTDEERLGSIDRIFEEVSDSLEFLRHFNGQVRMLELQRVNEIKDVHGTQNFLKYSR